MFFFDPLYLCFALPALFLALFAQWRVKSAYEKYLRVPNARGITGAEAAKVLLRNNNLGHVGIEGTPGTLTDFYDPRTKTMHLSDASVRSNSIASVAVVAHEIGHAVQDDQGYVPLKLRSAMVPGVQIGSNLGPILFMVGFLLAIYARSSIGYTIAWVGVILFSAALVFAFATLPVEFNASSRAKAMLADAGLVYSDEEMRGVRSVLDAAALTYVAAAAQALSTLLYYVFLLSGTRRRD